MKAWAKLALVVPSAQNPGQIKPWSIPFPALQPPGFPHSLPKSRGIQLAAGWKSKILQVWSCLTFVPCFVFLLGGGKINELPPSMAVI